MQKQKLVYEVPQTDALVVRFEDCILTVPSPATMNAMGLFDFSEGHGLKNDTDGWENNY